MASEKECVGSTSTQSTISRALQALGFNMIPDPAGKCGGPEEYTISEKALDALKGKTIVLKGDGEVIIK